MPVRTIKRISAKLSRQQPVPKFFRFFFCASSSIFSRSKLIRTDEASNQFRTTSSKAVPNARLGDMRSENQGGTAVPDTLEAAVFCMSRAFQTLVAPALPLQITIFSVSRYIGVRIPFECTLRNLARDLRSLVEASGTNILEVMSTRHNFVGSRILISVFLGSWR